MELKFLFLLVIALHGVGSTSTPDELLSWYEQILSLCDTGDSLKKSNTLEKIRAEIQLAIGAEESVNFHFTSEQESILVEKLNALIATNYAHSLDKEALTALDNSARPSLPPTTLTPLSPDASQLKAGAFSTAFHPSEQSFFESSQIFIIKLNQLYNHYFITKCQFIHFMGALPLMQGPILLPILEQELMYALAHNFQALAAQKYTEKELGLNAQKNFLRSISFYEANYLYEFGQALRYLEQLTETCHPSQLQPIELVFYFSLSKFFSTEIFFLPKIRLPRHIPNPLDGCYPLNFRAKDCPLHLTNLQRWKPAALTNLVHALRPFIEADFSAKLMDLITMQSFQLFVLIPQAFHQSSRTCKRLSTKKLTAKL